MPGEQGDPLLLSHTSPEALHVLGTRGVLSQQPLASWSFAEQELTCGHNLGLPALEEDVVPSGVRDGVKWARLLFSGS